VLGAMICGVDILLEVIEGLFVTDGSCREGPKRRPEGGGEWEPIQIPHGIWPISQNQPESITRKIQRR
jgi:hypothetical protein